MIGMKTKDMAQVLALLMRNECSLVGVQWDQMGPNCTQLTLRIESPNDIEFRTLNVTLNYDGFRIETRRNDTEWLKDAAKHVHTFAERLYAFDTTGEWSLWDIGSCYMYIKALAHMSPRERVR